MHLLRSTILPVYLQSVKPPFSSDALSVHPDGLKGSTSIPHREQKCLDLFIAVLARSARLYNESILHLSSETSAPTESADIFDLYQPRARLEDLLICESVCNALFELIVIDSTNTSFPPSKPHRARRRLRPLLTPDSQHPVTFPFILINRTCASHHSSDRRRVPKRFRRVSRELCRQAAALSGLAAIGSRNLVSFGFALSFMHLQLSDRYLSDNGVRYFVKA